MPKKIAVFADGTGNAFSVLETNVWRLYQALDRTRPDQISYYIKGVGTSGFRVLALLDGATGVGVPSNVRRLYRFISLNWDHGDEIYMFGFSRGAFTIRTLIALMHHEGLVPALIDNEAVSRGEMQHNIMAAWRSYRAKTISWKTRLPTIGLSRLVRDAVLGTFRIIQGFRSYASMAEETKKQNRRDVPIRFVGLFDTVEAYGVPLEDFRHAVDRVIWPISFTNQILSEHVERACHALSLDDERTTFHPLCIDRKKSVKPERIKEIWFAGVHSDIGGGYPEDDLARVPLTWIRDELGESLRFTTESFAENASPYAAIHDSRAGLGFFYRYGPRIIGDNGGPPTIHHSVAEKMAFGTERYAPATLPDTACVLMPDGNVCQIKGFDKSTSGSGSISDEKLKAKMELAEKAVTHLNAPDPAMVSLILPNIRRRRTAYLSLLFIAFLIASIPWTVTPAAVGLLDMIHIIAGWLGRAEQWDAFLASLVAGGQVSDGVAASSLLYIIINFMAVLPSINQIVSGVWKVIFSPEYAAVWSGAFLERPTISLILITCAIAFYARYASLHDRIADLAWGAWRSSGTTDQKPGNPVHVRIRRGRGLGIVAFAELVVARYLLPFGTLIVMLGLAGAVFNHSMVNYREARGAYCKKNDVQPSALEPGKSLTREGFTTDNLCWSSGVLLEKGRSYTLWIEMTDPPFFDQAVMADLAGFKDSSLWYLLALPFRRWWGADWFQPIARINEYGLDAWPLTSADGEGAVQNGEGHYGNDIPKRFYEDRRYQARLKELNSGEASDDPSRLAINEKIPPAELQAAKEIRQVYLRRKTYVSNFTAHSDGELFLYVNDALFVIPFGKTITSFYDNNTGRANVTVKLQSLPSP